MNERESSVPENLCFSSWLLI